MKKIPVWLDCDVGVDDAIAIMTAHALSEIDLLAISTVSGNAPLSATFPNAHRSDFDDLTKFLRKACRFNIEYDKFIVKTMFCPLINFAGRIHHIGFHTKDYFNAFFLSSIGRKRKCLHHAMVGNRHRFMPPFCCLRNIFFCARHTILRAHVGMQMQFHSLFRRKILFFRRLGNLRHLIEIQHILPGIAVIGIRAFCFNKITFFRRCLKILSRFFIKVTAAHRRSIIGYCHSKNGIFTVLCNFFLRGNDFSANERRFIRLQINNLDRLSLQSFFGAFCSFGSRLANAGAGCI